jgi:hypothetical protein
MACIPEGFCVKVHTVVGNIGQLMIEDDLNILSDLMNILGELFSS